MFKKKPTNKNVILTSATTQTKKQKKINSSHIKLLHISCPTESSEVI